MEGIGHAVSLMKRRNRRTWLAKRRRGITATDVPAILGLSPWATGVDVWLDKFRLLDVSVDYAMKRGIVLEGLLLTEYAQMRHTPLLPVPVLAGHPTDRLAMASLDGATMTDDGWPRLLEVKTTTYRQRADWWDEDKQVPDHVLAQVAWQQYVTGVGQTDVIVDVAGDVRIVGPIPRSPAFEEYVVPRMHEWWQRHIVEQQPPPFDPVRDYDAANLLWHPEPGLKRQIDETGMARALAYAAWSRREKEAADHKKELRGLIREQMGTATALIDQDSKSWARIDKRNVMTIKPPKPQPEDEQDR